jgi:hypothetical protein
MERSGRNVAASMVVVAAAVCASAADQVDLQIRGNERVSGTLYPSDERETFLVDVPRGARVTARVFRTEASAAAPVLSLIDRDAATVVEAVRDSLGARLTRHLIAESDRFGLRVESDGTYDGDYQFTLSVAPQRIWSQKPGDELAAGAETTFPFAAPAGSTVDVTLMPAPRSSFVPRIVEITGPDGFVAAVDGAGATPRRHGVRGVLLAEFGEHLVRIRNDGSTSGAFSIVARVVPPRLARSGTLDISDETLTNSRFDGDSRVFGRVLDAKGGLLFDLGDTQSPIAGASVSVPANAVSSPQIFAVQSSDDIGARFDPGNGSNHQLAGPTIRFLPEGKAFLGSVTVTIPYDPANFDDPVSQISITTEDPVTKLPVLVPGPYVVDTVKHTVSYSAAHFSRFQPASALARPLRGQFVLLEMGGRLTAGGGRATLSLSAIRAFPGVLRVVGGFDRAFPRRSIVWGPSAVAWNEVPPPVDPGVVTVNADDDVVMDDALDGAVNFTRGRNPDVLIRRPDGDSAGALVSVLLRRAKGLPTPSNLAGDWSAFVLEASARVFPSSVGGDNDVDLSMGGQVLDLSIGRDGRVTARSSVKFGAVADDRADGEGVGRWFFDQNGSRTPPKPGSISYPGDGTNTIRLTMPLGFRTDQASTVVLHPVLRGDLLVGVADNSDQPVVVGPLERLVVLARARGDRKRLPVLEGVSDFAAFGVAAIDLAGPPPVQDFNFFADDLVATHEADFDVSYAGRRDSYVRDALGAPFFASDPNLAADGRYFVDLDGGYRVTTPPFVGAVLLRPNAYLATRFSKGSMSLGFGVLRPRTQ